MRTVDFKEIARRARTMSNSELAYAIIDCREAGICAFELEKAGNRVDKNQGYYTDESTVYQAELLRRSAAMLKGGK